MMCGAFGFFMVGGGNSGKHTKIMLDYWRESDSSPRYNIRPGTHVEAFVEDRKIQMKQLNWGIKSGSGKLIINSRSETVAENLMFQDHYIRRRCLIPANGFYEWKSKSEPFYFTSKAAGTIFGFAGIFTPSHECTILTCSANNYVEPVHNRMPVILPESDWDRWLAPNMFDPESLQPYDANLMRCHLVSTRVNRSDYDAPDCIEPVEPNPTLL